MTCLQLDEAQARTLHDMGIHHPHPCVRQRAQALVQLARGDTLATVAATFAVHLNSVENWARSWRQQGLVGLFQPPRPGRPPKWDAQHQQALGELAEQRGGSVPQLLDALGADDISDSTARRYLQEQGLSYHRSRYAVKKKRDEPAFRRAQAIIGGLAKLARQGLCRLLFFDESGFSPNPPVTYGWARRGQTHAIVPQAHHERINVLGALDQAGSLAWTTVERPTRQEDVIAFFDRLSAQVGTLPHIVVLDNAGIHRAKAVERCRRRWARQGLGLFFLPPYSPELNRIEILWKQAKHFWRRPLGLTGAALRDEVHRLLRGFGSQFTINFD